MHDLIRAKFAILQRSEKMFEPEERGVSYRTVKLVKKQHRHLSAYDTVARELKIMRKIFEAAQRREVAFVTIILSQPSDVFRERVDNVLDCKAFSGAGRPEDRNSNRLAFRKVRKVRLQ